MKLTSAFSSSSERSRPTNLVFVRGLWRRPACGALAGVSVGGRQRASIAEGRLSRWHSVRKPPTPGRHTVRGAGIASRVGSLLGVVCRRSGIARGEIGEQRILARAAVAVAVVALRLGAKQLVARLLLGRELRLACQSRIELGGERRRLRGGDVALQPLKAQQPISRKKRRYDLSRAMPKRARDKIVQQRWSRC
jgi:hypothetical protein